MELNVRQQRILRGEICPYCGRETELVNADKIYSRKGLGMVMMFDILPRLKAMGFLDTNVWNPGISTAGITHTLQFGNALPKNVFRC